MRAFFIRLRTNWLRNLLAILQVGLAIAAVTAVFTSVLPVLRMAIASDEDTVFEVRFGSRTSRGVTWNAGIFQLGDVKFLLEQAESIEGASVNRSESMVLIRLDNDRYAVHGLGHISPTYSKIMGLEMVEGSFFSEAEAGGTSSRVVVISDELAEILFGETSPIGKEINLRPNEELRSLTGGGLPIDQQAFQSAPGTNLEIIGTFKGQDDFVGLLSGLTLHMLILGASERMVTSLISDAPPDSTPTPRVLPMPYDSILVKARDGMAREAEEEVRTLLRARLEERGKMGHLMDGVQSDVMVDSVQDRSASLRQVRLQGAMITGAMGLAALIVAGFAVFTTTLANLAQRTRDIGLARSIGATRGYVIRDVVMEAALLAGLGGIIGVVAAYPLGRYVLTPLQLPMGGETLFDTLIAGAVGVALAAVIGAGAALFPAWTVARLMPAEAWREGRA